jgi:hypothetical protein
MSPSSSPPAPEPLTTSSVALSAREEDSMSAKVSTATARRNSLTICSAALSEAMTVPTS